MYTILKPCKLNGIDYTIGETAPDSAVTRETGQTLLRRGYLAKQPELPACESATVKQPEQPNPKTRGKSTGSQGAGAR